MVNKNTRFLTQLVMFSFFLSFFTGHLWKTCFSLLSHFATSTKAEGLSSITWAWPATTIFSGLFTARPTTGRQRSCRPTNCLKLQRFSRQKKLLEKDFWQITCFKKRPTGKQDYPLSPSWLWSWFAKKVCGILFAELSKKKLFPDKKKTFFVKIKHWLFSVT